MPSADVIVVGGGIVGAALAFELAERGASVRLLERDRIAAHASGASAGMLVPIGEGPAGGPVFELGVAALSRWSVLAAEAAARSGIDPTLRAGGSLRVAREPEAEALRARATRLAGHGCQWLGREELRKREPALSHALVGALWSPRDAWLDPERATHALARAASLRGAVVETGVEVVDLAHSGERVTGVETRAGPRSARDTVLCTGAWTRLAERWCAAHLPGAPRLPVRPVKGQMLALDAPADAPRSLVFADEIYLVPRESGELRVGATMDEVGFDPRPTAAGVRELLAAACAVIPSLEQSAFRRTWAGLRPGTPDGFPLVGPLAPGLWVSAGHFRSGVLWSPITALCLASWITEGAPDPALVLFSPERESLRDDAGRA